VTLHVGPATFLPIRGDEDGASVLEGERCVISDEAATRIRRARAEGRRVIAVGTTSTRALESCALQHGAVEAGAFLAAAFITPGFRFQAVDGILTNFHLPRSTLLLLVAALASPEHVLAWYDLAIREGYRFYSFGDAMLLL
jgi:S-adenosylmethionine:tRNA ribosyltransferase-isomerase